MVSLSWFFFGLASDKLLISQTATSLFLKLKILTGDKKMAQHYSGYSKFSVEPYSNYDFSGLEINNNTNEEYHIFIKKLDDIDI